MPHPSYSSAVGCLLRLCFLRSSRTPLLPPMPLSFYAVARGRSTGVFNSWAECQQQVLRFPGAVFKKFATFQQAADFVHCSRAVDHSSVDSQPTPSLATTVDTECSVAVDSHAEVPAEPAVRVYTDGSCLRNGRRKARAGIGVYWGEKHPDNLSQPLQGRPTNNRAEIMACVEALRQAQSRGYRSVLVLTDSELLVNTMRRWVHRWRRNGWQTVGNQPVKNQSELEQLWQLSFEAGMRVTFEHVRGHCGIEGNEHANRLAVRGSKMARPPVGIAVSAAPNQRQL